MSFLFKTAAHVVMAEGFKHEGRVAKAAEEYNAKIEENQAELEFIESKEQARRARIENEAVLGNQMARRAAHGVEVSSGSALLTHAETAGRLELAIFENNRMRDNRAMQAQSRANMHRFTGEQVKKASKFRAGASLLSGGATLAKGLFGI